MKKLVIGVLAATAAMTATPALASSIHVGFYSPAPVYYQPAPVIYRPAPVYYQQAYYAPPRYYVDNHHGRGHGRGHDKHYARWGQPRYYGWNN